MSKVNKSYEITDARIQFVSLVDKAANKKKFLITKQEGASAGFQTLGRILKVDADSHYVTGVVYEPNVADAHDNYMTEAEIEKAAHWFMKSGDKVDIQHSFEEADGLTVVESWVAKSDSKIEGQDIAKGTWLMTVEISNDEVWDAVEKGELTGLSMGGVGNYSTKDTDPESGAPVSKAEAEPDKLTLLEQIAKALGFKGAVQKGEMREKFEQTAKASMFWDAFWTLEGLLRRWDYWTDQPMFENDEAKVREALQEFSEIIESILLSDGNITKALHDAHDDAATEAGHSEPVEKAGKKMSTANKEKLNSICQQLSDFAKEFDDPDPEPDPDDDGKDEADDTENKTDTEKEDEDEMNKDDIQKMIDESIRKAMKPAEQPAEQTTEQVEKSALTADEVQKMIDAAVEKAVKPVEKADEQPAAEEPAPNTMDENRVQKMIQDTLAKALQARGVPTAMDDGSTDPIEKADETHYLHGIL